MIKQTTIELDEELVERARVVLQQPTVRATVEEALRRAIRSDASSTKLAVTAQIKALSKAATLTDVDVMTSGEAWR
jgi:Arc/MetJ family transcription regulator